MKGGTMRKLSLALIVMCASVALVGGVLASSAGAYGGGANHEMWQIGISFNCNNPHGACDAMGGTGGIWGWAEFDRSADGTQTWGDGEFTGCGHTVGGVGGPG